MLTNIKPKRKHDTRTRLKLKLILLAFIIGTIIATLFPMIWLAPPLFAFTPLVYVVLSLLWIPIMWKAAKLVVWDRIVKLLITVCLLSSIFMTFFFQQNLTGSLQCYGSEGLAHSCQISYVEYTACEVPGFWVTDIGLVLIAHQPPWNSKQYVIFCPMF